jgi:hypothetical protein
VEFAALVGLYGFQAVVVGLSQHNICVDEEVRVAGYSSFGKHPPDRQVVAIRLT